jgi:hypothetical protein
MKLIRVLRYPLSLVAAAGLFSLLLADSAEEMCSSTFFDRTFDVTTTCGGNHSGRIRIVDSIKVGVSAREVPATVSRSSGDIFPIEASVTGACSDEDEPFVTTGIVLKLPSSAPSNTGAGGGGGAGGVFSSSSSGGDVGAVAARCAVDLKTELGKDLTCSIVNDTGATLGTCAVHISAVQ